MRRYLLRRLLLLFPTLVGITLITFVVVNLMPGGPVEALSAGDSMHRVSPEVLDQYRRDLGFDRPLPVRYLEWLGRLVRFDFGRSFRDHRDVWPVIRERLPQTLLLNASALGLMFLLALPLGWLSAMWRGGRLDRIAAVGLYLLYCLPNFAVALLLQILLASHWGLLPLQGMESSYAADLGLLARIWDRFLHLLLPAICLSLAGLAYLTRFARAGLLESIGKEYVTVARAKGLSRRAAVLKHALRNSLIPLLTLAGMMIPALLGGSVIIERIFSWPGIGRLFFTAIGGRDYPVILGLTTLSALLSLGGFLASDLLYAWADPRVVYARRDLV